MIQARDPFARSSSGPQSQHGSVFQVSDLLAARSDRDSLELSDPAHTFVMDHHPHPPFLPSASTAQPGSVALLHLRRDNTMAVCLQGPSSNGLEDTGYAEGYVANTRFGSFPHSTLLDASWGSQLLASQVDTGSRGQKRKKTKQDKSTQQVPLIHPSTPPRNTHEDQHNDNPTSPRKRPASALDSQASEPPAKKHQAPAKHNPQPVSAKQAPTGFAHILPLTPEGWTISLPHRTQVVYTPDYSYIIQRLRIRPGSRVIEAGAGSGSFTHAAARAVYDGKSGGQAGRVFSYEYHQPRAEQLQHDIREHNLDGLIQATHRDVYRDGFGVHAAESDRDAQSPCATAIFLDLPDPPRALPHLTRRPYNNPSSDFTPPAPVSPLDPERPVHICAFLPCIEQVTAFTSALRAHDWVEIQMAELMHHRLEVRRERVGLDLEGLRGVNATAANVDESIARLREVQQRDREFRDISSMNEKTEGGVDIGNGEVIQERKPQETRAERLERIKHSQEGAKAWKEGRLVCRTEPEVKSHTSYLVFAVLPREWSGEDERRVKAVSQQEQHRKVTRTDTGHSQVQANED